MTKIVPKCPECQSATIEETVTMIMTTPIRSVFLDDGVCELDLGNASSDPEDVNGEYKYQCSTCQHVVANDLEDFIKFLAKQEGL